jgi:hypothetical protein
LVAGGGAHVVGAGLSPAAGWRAVVVGSMRLLLAGGWAAWDSAHQRGLGGSRCPSPFDHRPTSSEPRGRAGPRLGLDTLVPRYSTGEGSGADTGGRRYSTGGFCALRCWRGGLGGGGSRYARSSLLDRQERGWGLDQVGPRYSTGGTRVGSRSGRSSLATGAET